MPRAAGDRRRDDRKRASEQMPALRRAGNDRIADAGLLRSAFVSLPAWLIDCFCCPAAKRGKPQQAWRAGARTSLARADFFRLRL